MYLRPSLQLATSLRAMTEVIIPAIDQSNKMAVEQAHLVVGMLSLLNTYLPVSFAYDMDELQRSVALHDEIVRITKSPPPAEPASHEAAEVAAARTLLEAPPISPDQLELAVRTMRAALGALVTTTFEHGDEEERQAVGRAVLTSAKDQLLRERVLMVSQGWESQPETLPPLSDLILTAAA